MLEQIFRAEVWLTLLIVEELRQCWPAFPLAARCSLTVTSCTHTHTHRNVLKYFTVVCINKTDGMFCLITK